MRNKDEIINSLIQEHGYAKYLEIGYGNGQGFKAIKCDNKYSVDPNGKADFVGTSDEYFDKTPKTKKFNVILVDGLHHAGQVRRDIINSSKHLTKNGCIVLHDVNPNSKETQTVPCQTGIWEGDCWRAFVGFMEWYPDVETKCYLEDHGVGIIFPLGQKFEHEFENMDMDYEEFEANKKELLGV